MFFHELGVPIAENKIKFLGLEVDTVAILVGLSSDNLEDLKSVIGDND